MRGSKQNSMRNIFKGSSQDEEQIEAARLMSADIQRMSLDANDRYERDILKSNDDKARRQSLRKCADIVAFVRDAEIQLATTFVPTSSSGGNCAWSPVFSSNVCLLDNRDRRFGSI